MSYRGLYCLYCGDDHESYECPNPQYWFSDSVSSNSYSAQAQDEEFSGPMTLDDMVCQKCGGRHWTFACNFQYRFDYHSQELQPSEESFRTLHQSSFETSSSHGSYEPVQTPSTPRFPSPSFEVEDQMDMNNHKDDLEPIEEKEEIVMTNMVYPNPLTSALILENINIEDTPQLAPKEKKIGEVELEIEIANTDPPPILQLIKCVRDDQLHAQCLKPTGYIIEFVLAQICNFPPHQKLMFSLFRGIVLKRNRARTRQRFPLLALETWEWNTFPWDPGG